MTIQLDDAGWGCLIGGVIVGAYRLETQEFACEEIPARFFQPPLFGQRASACACTPACAGTHADRHADRYLDKAVEVAGRLLMDELGVQPGEEIQVCSGYVLSNVGPWLAQAGLLGRKVKVEGPLQVLVETALQQSLAALGLDVSYDVLTRKQGLLFWKCLHWLKGGNINATRAVAERERHAKTGWASYGIWVGHPYAQAKQLAAQAKAARKQARRPW